MKKGDIVAYVHPRDSKELSKEIFNFIETKLPPDPGIQDLAIALSAIENIRNAIRMTIEKLGHTIVDGDIN